MHSRRLFKCDIILISKLGIFSNFAVNIKNHISMEKIQVEIDNIEYCASRISLSLQAGCSSWSWKIPTNWSSWWMKRHTRRFWRRKALKNISLTVIISSAMLDLAVGPSSWLFAMLCAAHVLCWYERTLDSITAVGSMLRCYSVYIASPMVNY